MGGGEKPTCGNCIKSKRICTGYQRKHVFVLQNLIRAPNEPSSSVTPADRSGLELSQLVELSPMLSRGDGGSELSAPRRSELEAPNARAYQMSPPTFLPHHITARNAFRQQLLDLFVVHHLPEEAVNAGRHRTAGPGHWLVHLSKLPDHPPSLANALLAICSSRLARFRGHRALEYESLFLFTGSLRELQVAIRNPSTRYKTETLTTCMALTMYEFSEAPGLMKQAYTRHYAGAMALMEARGAAAHADGLDHSVFQALRLHTVFQGIKQRSTTFLRHGDWLKLPWASTRKNIYDRLLDILLQVPTLYVKADVIERESSPREILDGTLDIVRLAWLLDRRLSQWFAKFKSLLPGPMYWLELSGIDSIADSADRGKVFPVSFKFPAYAIGQTIVLYWIGLLIVHHELCESYRNICALTEAPRVQEAEICTCPSREASEDTNLGKASEISTCVCHFYPSTLPPLGDRADWATTTARNICQSMEYFVDDRGRGLGSAGTVPRLMIVQKQWKTAPGDYQRELLWIQDMLNRLQPTNRSREEQSA